MQAAGLRAGRNTDFYSDVEDIRAHGRTPIGVAPTWLAC
jgi:hypothetical protein